MCIIRKEEEEEEEEEGSCRYSGKLFQVVGPATANETVVRVFLK